MPMCQKPPPLPQSPHGDPSELFDLRRTAWAAVASASRVRPLRGYLVRLRGTRPEWAAVLAQGSAPVSGGAAPDVVDADGYKVDGRAVGGVDDVGSPSPAPAAAASAAQPMSVPLMSRAVSTMCVAAR